MSVVELTRKKMHHKEEFTGVVVENIHFFKEQVQLMMS